MRSARLQARPLLRILLPAAGRLAYDGAMSGTRIAKPPVPMPARPAKPEASGRSAPASAVGRAGLCDAIAVIAAIPKTTCAALLDGAPSDRVRLAGWSAMLGRLVRGRSGYAAGALSGNGWWLRQDDMQAFCCQMAGLPDQTDGNWRLLAWAAVLMAADGSVMPSPLGSGIMSLDSEQALCALAFGKTLPEIIAAQPGDMPLAALEGLAREEAPGRRLAAFLGDPGLSGLMRSSMPAEAFVRLLAGRLLHACWGMAPASRTADEVFAMTEGLAEAGRAMALLAGVVLAGGSDAGGGRRPPPDPMAWERAMAMLECGIEATQALSMTGEANAAYCGMASEGLAALIPLCIDPLPRGGASDPRMARVARMVRQAEAIDNATARSAIWAPLSQALAERALGSRHGCGRGRTRS